MIDFESSDAASLDNKSILLLLNNKKVVYDDSSYETYQIRPYTSHHWIPV